MKKIDLTEVDVFDGYKKTKIKIFETPTLLKEMFLKGEIELEEYAEKTKIYKETIKEKDNLLNKKTRLRDYQQKIVKYAKNLKSFAIFDDPRLGKTPTVIELIKEKGLINEKIIVICPESVIGNWKKTILEWSGKEATKYNGGKIKNNFIIITYTRARLSLREIEKWEPKVVILDEAHILRNSRGISQNLTKKQKEIYEKTKLRPINKSILRIGKKAKHRFALSGTPAVNKPKDIFAILQFILPNTFNSFWTFAHYFFKIEENFMGGKIIGDYKSEKKKIQLQEMLDYFSSNNKKENVLKWLNKTKIRTVELELNNEQKRLERDLIEKGLIGDTFILNEIESMIHYISIVLNPRILKYNKTKDYGSKTEYILKYLKETNLNIAIFTTRKKNVEELKKILEKELTEKTFYTIPGKKSTIEIQNIINEKSEKNDIILIGTIGKCKEGITLEGINKAIVTDQTYVPTDMKQLFERLNATTKEAQDYFGEKEIILLKIPNTIDDIIEDTLINKRTKTELINNYKKFIEERKETC
jgi:SNF2 family DNA or RNA helicase